MHKQVAAALAGAALAVLPSAALAAPAAPLTVSGQVLTVSGQVSGSGSLAGLAVRPEGLETATPNRYAPERGCAAPCTLTSAAGAFSVAADAGSAVSAVRASDGAGVQLTVPATGTALPPVELWTSPVTASTADGRLALSWTPPAGATSYSVELQSNGDRLGTVTTAKPSVTVDARLVEDASLIAIVRAVGSADGTPVQWQAPFALVPTSRPTPPSRGAACVVTTAAGQQARDTLSACGLADGDLTNPAMLPGGARPQRAALDLGSSQAVGLVVVRTAGLVVVQTSEDGTTWTTLDSAVEQDPVTGSYVQLLTTPVQARYVGVVAAAGTSAAPPTSDAPTPPAETSSPPPAPVRTSASPTPAATSARPSSAAPPTSAAPTSASPTGLPTLLPSSASPTPTRTSAAPTPSAEPTSAAPTTSAAAARRARFAAPATALPVLEELSVWTGPQPALSGDVAPSPVAVPGVAASGGAARSSSGSSVLPLVGGGIVALAVVAGGAFVVLRRRGQQSMGS